MPDQDSIELKDAPSLSRRGLLRAAAWTAPVIAVAATAPFAAASGGDIVIHFNNATFNKSYADWPNDWGGVEGNLQIGRQDTEPPPGNLTQLTVQLILPSDLQFTGVASEVDLAGSDPGWSVLSVSVGPTLTVYFITFSGVVAPYGNTGTLRFHIPSTIVSPMSQIGSFSATAFADSTQVVSSISSSTTL
ncbi:MAG: hypothetical protein KF772_00745 [Cryobacterium sp.]|nr:hypothetical protein [Cryobacterium sp.]MCC7128596.1 hypothetical protein [Microbacteriaceae bacterium]